jgi:hypothetical protein
MSLATGPRSTPRSGLRIGVPSPGHPQRVATTHIAPKERASKRRLRVTLGSGNMGALSHREAVMSDDRDRPKRSWKEIDQMRDGSRRRDDRPQGPKRGPRSQKSYRAALDRAFSSGAVGQLVKDKDIESGEELDEAKAKLLRAILDAEDRPTITKAVDAYLAAYESFPADPDVLAKVVQHKNPTRQLEAMEQLEPLLDERAPKRVRALIGHLKLIRDTADDPELETIAKRLLDALE